MRIIKTLDKLTEVLKRESYSSKRLSVYLGLLTRNGRTREGKQHVTLAPVKLISGKSLKHQSHSSTKFAGATIKALQELDGLLGLGALNFHS